MILDAERGATLSPRVLVLGGAGIDIIGVSDVPVAAADSNPGHTRVTAGGVGRNVAANLARMGAAVTLITVFGGDPYSRSVAGECRALGLDVSRSLEVPDAQGAMYVAIVDTGGELVSAVSDMRIMDALTPEALRVAVAGVRPVGGVVVDTNLSLVTLDMVFAIFDNIPVFADAVSAAKAPRLLPFLGQIELLKASAAEAEVLSGEVNPARAADSLVERGVGNAWVTAGPAGAYWARSGERGFEPAPAVDVVNTTGAGDAFMAGVVYSRLEGWGVGRSARYATGAAALTIASDETVSPEMGEYAARAVEEWEDE